MENIFNIAQVVGILIAFGLALLTFIVQTTTKWWRTRAGVAFWAFNVSFLVLAGHFAIEELTGIQSPIRELVAIAVICSTLGWAFWTVTFKRFFWSADDPIWDPFHRTSRKK